MTPEEAVILEAKRIKLNYGRRLDRLRVKATCGDNEAAKNILSLLAEYHGKLKDLGYRTTDETEDGRVNRLVLITEEWKQEQNNKMTAIDKLQEKARQTQDPKDIKALIRALSQINCG